MSSKERKLIPKFFVVARGALVFALGFFTLCCLLLAPCSSVQAQQPKQVYRIGYLSITDPATESSRIAAIRLALRELGYVEGRNIAVEFRYGEGSAIGIPSLRLSW